MAPLSDIQSQELWDRAGEVFVPFAPIHLVGLFQGRQKEINQVTTALKLAGRHAVIYGDRGVGKTSLANLVSFFANWDEQEIFSYSCGETDTFQTIFDGVFSKNKQGLRQNGEIEEKSSGIAARYLSFGRKLTKTHQPVEQFAVDANSVFELLRGEHVLIILDEFDRVKGDDTKLAIAELIKKLSDVRSQSKLLLVGVGRTISELVGKHQSAPRFIEQVPMLRMSKNDIKEILRGGFDQLGITISSGFNENIAKISDGYPHFAHLLGLKLVQAMLDRLAKESGNELAVSQEKDFLPAINTAIEGSEHTLKDAYIRGIETPNVKTDLYRWILEGIAVQDDVEVGRKEILEYINKLSDRQIKSQGISHHLGKLVNLDEKNILEKPRTGCFRFKDPMLRAFVRMQIAGLKLSEAPAYRQLELQFTD